MEKGVVKEKKKNIGEISLELAKKAPVKHTAEDQMREQLSNYDANVHECVAYNKNKLTGDFYVVCLVKKERLMQNVFRGYFFARTSCPTPDYDQTVYKYSRAEDRLEFLWVVPDASAVNYMKNNVSSVEPDKYALLEFVLKFADGSLLRLSKELNSEKADSNIIEN